MSHVSSDPSMSDLSFFSLFPVGDPVRGKIFNVGVPHVDECVQPGWWKKGAAGVEDAADIEVIVFPDLDVAEVEGVAAQVQVQGEVL